jgi:hypothetical protein
VCLGSINHNSQMEAQPDLSEAVEQSVAEIACRLMDRGFAHVDGQWQDRRHAWDCALGVFAEASLSDPLKEGMPNLEVIGEFTVPPPDAFQRPFQALHIDFGLPLGGEIPVDVARFTALLRDARENGRGATTRLIPLRRLLAHQTWAKRPLIAQRLGRIVSADRTVEGILGRLIEVAQQGSELVPFDTPGHLCGMEFDSLEHEWSFFEDRGLPLTEVEEHVFLEPGELLLIDNLRTAHGRSGLRTANELHQLFVGYSSLCAEEQRLLLDQFLVVFDV